MKQTAANPLIQTLFGLCRANAIGSLFRGYKIRRVITDFDDMTAHRSNTMNRKNIYKTLPFCLIVIIASMIAPAWAETGRESGQAAVHPKPNPDLNEARRDLKALCADIGAPERSESAGTDGSLPSKNLQALRSFCSHGDQPSQVMNFSCNIGGQIFTGTCATSAWDLWWGNAAEYCDMAEWYCNVYGHGAFSAK